MHDRGELSYVQLRLADGTQVRLSPGALIGRLSSADLRFAEPTVSEAHALVSLRGRELKLLALRRWFHVGGHRLSELSLAPGQHIHLAPEVELVVEEVHVAPRILALSGLDPDPYELSASVHSVIRRGGKLVAEPKYLPDALGHVSSSTDGWVLRTAAGEVLDLAVGTRFVLDGEEIVAVPLDTGSPTSTVAASPTSPPLRVVARYDTVHLHVEGRTTVVISGIGARIVSELAALGCPVPWQVVAHEIWQETDERVLRQNWDRNMRSLRARLRSLGLRDDLVRPDGRGNTELFLLPGDELVNDQ
jgi:hypothetical protein